MQLTWHKRNSKGVFGVLTDNKGGTYMVLTNPSKFVVKEGKYHVRMTWSERFQCFMPLVWNEDVPASRGIRIHAGNTAKDSQGCLLLGDGFDLKSMALTYSQDAVRQFIASLKDNVTYTLKVNGNV